MVNISLDVPRGIRIQKSRVHKRNGHIDYDEYKNSLPENIYPNSGEYLRKSVKKYLEHGVELPTKLYEVNDEKISVYDETDEEEGNYAILSHSLEYEKEGIKGKIPICKGNECYPEKIEISKGAYKSITKSEIVCKYLGIEYLWVDKLCIDQKDDDEVEKEMQKMSNYYGNATITLVAIHEDLGRETKELFESEDEENRREAAKETIQKIVNSRWFSRAWTFQEGLLSQRTLFMFDDCLIDGTWLAQYWASNFEDYYVFSERICEFKNTKSATLIGWVYYENGYRPSDNYGGISSAIGLNRTLEITIENQDRGVSIPKDIIYSVLGLFQFGKEVEYEYEQLCGGCEGREEDNCSHDEQYKEKDPYYSWEDLEEGLKEVWDAFQEGKEALLEKDIVEEIDSDRSLSQEEKMNFRTAINRMKENIRKSDKEECRRIIYAWWEDTEDKYENKSREILDKLIRKYDEEDYEDSERSEESETDNEYEAQVEDTTRQFQRMSYYD